MKLLLLGCLGTALMGSSLNTSAYVQVTSALSTVENTQTGTDSAHSHASVGDGLGLSFGDLVSSAAYGGLSVSGQIYSSSEPSHIVGIASFLDTLTIFGGSGVGLLRWRVDSNCVSLDIFCFVSNTGTLPLINQSSSAYFLYGVPFTIGLSMTASDHGEGAYLSQNLSVSNFRVDGATDALMYKSESGASYDFHGVQHIMLEGPVVHNPEPGTWWTLAGGGFLIILGKMKKAQWGNWASKEDSTI